MRLPVYVGEHVDLDLVAARGVANVRNDGRDAIWVRLDRAGAVGPALVGNGTVMRDGVDGSPGDRLAVVEQLEGDGDIAVGSRMDIRDASAATVKRVGCRSGLGG